MPALFPTPALLSLCTTARHAIGRLLAWCALPAVAALLTACAGSLDSQQITTTDSLDMTAYNRLTLVSTQPGIRIYRYLTPNFRRSDFRTVMVDPIVLYQPAEKAPGRDGITDETLYRIRNSMDIAMRQLVRKQFGISYKPGQQVARLSTAITGVLLDGEAFRPRLLIPVSGVLRAAGNGNTIENSTPYLMVEAKLLNSLTGSLMGEGVYLIASDQFRREVDSPEKFQQLATQWIRGAVSVASGLK